MPPLTPSECSVLLGLKAVDGQRLEAYVDLLRHWQRRINLVGDSTLADPWRRHILDSAQLLPLIPETAGTLLDLGTGAGLPGLVIAILHPGLQVTLVERDARKCAFLGEAIRLTGAAAKVVNADMGATPAFAVDVVTARAVAPLPKLLALVGPWLAFGGRGLFPKGRDVRDELTAAREFWNITADEMPSRSDDAGRILIVYSLERRRDR